MNSSTDIAKEESSHCSALNVSHSDIIIDLKNRRYEGLPDMLIFNFVITIAILTILFPIPTKIEEFINPKRYSLYITNSGVAMKEFAQFVCSKDWLFLREEIFLPMFGREGYHLLCFQRYIILSLIVMCIVNLGVIMPINIVMGDVKYPDTFSASTLGNLTPRSSFIWAHIIVGNLNTFVMMVTMGHFLGRLQHTTLLLKDESKKLLLKGLPRSMRLDQAIRRWLKEKYPWTRVQYVSFVYEINKIKKLKVDLIRVKKVLSRITEKDKIFGKARCFGSCCCHSETDAKLHYETQRNQILYKLNKERWNKVIHEPLDWAFIEFKSHDDVKFILDCENCDLIKEKEFRVLPAPNKDNIEWQNFHTGLGALMREILVNLSLILTFIFFTTPQIVMGNLEDITSMISHKKDIQVPSLLQTYIPIIMTQIIGKASIFFVMLSTRLLGYITQTKINQKILTRGSAYFLLIVLILPAFGSLSIESLLQLYWNLFIQGSIGDEKSKSRWECIFLPNSGLFFIDYLITSAFLGNVFQLYKVKKLIKLVKDSLFSSSWTEVKVRSSEGIGRIWFGQQYAYFIVQFFIGAALGVSCPWVTAFSLLFMVLRHLVDTDHFRKPCEYTKLGEDFYNTLIFIAIGGTLFQQFFTTLFLVIKSHGEEHFLEAEMFSALFFLISTFIMCCELSSRWRRPFSLLYISKFLNKN